MSNYNFTVSQVHIKAVGFFKEPKDKRTKAYKAYTRICAAIARPEDLKILVNAK